MIREQMKSKLNSSNACYHSVQNILSSRLPVVKIKKYKTIILNTVLYGCETWPLTLREKRILRVSGNRMLGLIFGSKKDEVTGDWRIFHYQELYNLYCFFFPCLYSP
jgi:hypothetical protein